MNQTPAGERVHIAFFGRRNAGIGALLCFVIYDIALTRLISYYLIKLRKRFRIK